MSTMNISVTEELKRFVDEQVDSGAYASASEYLRSLIRHEMSKEKLDKLLLEGLSSPRISVPDKNTLRNLITQTE